MEIAVSAARATNTDIHFRGAREEWKTQGRPPKSSLVLFSRGGRVKAVTGVELILVWFYVTCGSSLVLIIDDHVNAIVENEFKIQG